MCKFRHLLERNGLGTEFDQERLGRARPRDASDEERQSVVLRHEGPCRCWTRRPSSFTRWRQPRRTCMTATCCRFMGEKPASGATAPMLTKAELSPAAKDLRQKRGRDYKYLKPRQCNINRARSRVCARVEHAIGIIKRIFGFTKVLSRHCEECESAVRRLWARQSVHGATPLDANAGGVVRPKSEKTPVQSPIGRRESWDATPIAFSKPNSSWKGIGFRCVRRMVHPKSF